MQRRFITASDLYNYRKCRFRPYMDYNGDPSIKVEVHPLVKLLWEAGVQYESKVVDSLKADNSDKSFIQIAPKTPASEDLAVKTLETMKAGADFIYQGVLIAENRMGRPDLLIKDSGKSTLGNYLYYPMDIKLAQVDDTWDNGDERLKIEQVWQLHFYGRLLENIQGVRPSSGFIYKTKSRKLPVKFNNAPSNYDQALAQLESYLNGDPRDAEPAIGGDCKMCEWKEYCVRWAEDRNDVSLLYYAGNAMKTGLRKLGIQTVDDLADKDPETLLADVLKLKKESYFWNSMPEDLIGRLVKRANIAKNQIPVIHEPIVFPESGIEIHFDIEGDPTQDFIYLHGLLLIEDGRDPIYTSFFADSYDDEKKITEKLFDYLRKYEGVPIYHYAHYEKTTLRRLIDKHKIDDKGVYEMLFGDKGMAIDLFRIIEDKTDWPLTSYSVKAICKLLGFKWNAPDASGSSSIVWMNDYLAGDKAMKDKILQYNEDDCQATFFLKNKLIEMQKGGF